MTQRTQTEPEVIDRTARRRAGLLPPRSDLLVRWFHLYVTRYMRKRFHAMRLANSAAVPFDEPLIVYLNHPSWWDPLTCLVVAHAIFATRKHFAPIDAAPLERYGILKRLGFFGIEPQSHRGGVNFLRTAAVILRQPGGTLWLTPEGQFTDPRSRSTPLQPGLAHLLTRVDRLTVIPLAVEYPFWHESKPEVLGRFGVAIQVRRNEQRSVEEWNQLLTQRLRETQEELAPDAAAQDPARFNIILGGTAGVGGIYDAWRRFRAHLAGQSFMPDHDP